jgi:hypothetical protein
MIYLGTNEIGHDASEIGFPEIHSCQAILYQTTNMLYGWHDSSGSVTHLKAKAAKFNTYVQGVDMSHSTKAVRIVGVINSNHRFSKASQDIWQQELLAVAEALGFLGPVLGYRVTSHLGSAKDSGQGGGDKMYVRFDRGPKGWRVFYKTWHKLQYGQEVDEPDDNRQQFKGTELGTKLYDHLAVVKKDPSSGKLHEIGHSSFIRFQ